jgi:LuxR family quorum sensing-dependent transcriptional regulator
MTYEKDAVMPQSFAYGREALEFIHGLTHADSTEVVGSMQQMIAAHGLKTVLFFGLPTRNQRFDEVVLGKHWPLEWWRIYSERHYVHDDPMVRRLRQAVTPFEWSEVKFDAERYPRAAELMHLRSDFGFGNALVVPIPGKTGTLAGVSMGGERPELTQWNKPAIHIMALYAFQRLLDLRNGRGLARTALTNREREVLTWAAVGKSAWDIGEILSIAARTVNEHVQTSMTKLGAANRTHAVALALRDGIISL